jgi:polyisoprenoid-binding protein YceI
MATRRRWLRWVIAAAGAVVVLAVGGPFVYIHFIEGPAPAPLSLKPGGGQSSSPAAAATSPVTGTPGSSSLAGMWRAGSGSVVGYRVDEVLLGQGNVAVGRSSSVTGNLEIRGTTVTAAEFSVPMASIHSDQSQRDAQFDGRIMDVASYPTGTFTLTKVIDLGSVPAVGVVRTYTATGNLTLHGHTRTVTFTVSAERTGSAIKISGSIPVLFARWAIPNPSFGSFVTTQNHGVLEFLLDFTKT